MLIMPQSIAEALNTVAESWHDGRIAPEDKLEEILNYYRALRNGCVGNFEYQTACGTNLTLLKDTLRIMNWLSTCDNEESALCVRVATQFLGNLIVSHSANQLIVWNIFSPFLK